VQKKLHQASDTIEKAKVRSRAVGRKLKDVQELPVGEATALLPTNVLEDDEEAGEDDSVEGD
jgi:DNA recombination protein RmuC